MLQPVIRPTARTCDKGKFASPFNTICRFTYSHAKISLAPSGKSVVLVCASRPTRGALRDRHECWARDAMGALVSLDEWHRCARRNRVVLISRRWDQVSRSIREATVAIKPRSPGRARISRKAIARGMPVAPAEPVVTAACFFVAGGPWVRPASGIPRALSSSRDVVRQDSGAHAPRECSSSSWTSEQRDAIQDPYRGIYRWSTVTLPKTT